MKESEPDFPANALLYSVLAGFACLSVLEAIFLTCKGRPLCVWDALTSFLSGLFMHVISAWLPFVIRAPYVWVHEQTSSWRNRDTLLGSFGICLEKASPSPSSCYLQHALVFLVVDFWFYWAHRCSHRINLLWTAHSVHHSAEHYHLFTALRQGVLQPFGGVLFYLSLAPFVPVSVFQWHSMLNAVGQLWLHTQVIPELGVLEKVINTPSQHRVHHGRNPYCIDKNFGGILSIWDHLFGTYERERPVIEEEIRYGLVHLPSSASVIDDNVRHFREISWTNWYRSPGDTEDKTKSEKEKENEKEKERKTKKKHGASFPRTCSSLVPPPLVVLVTAIPPSFLPKVRAKASGCEL